MGLPGLTSEMAFVRGVMCLRIASGRKMKSSCSSHGTTTGTPPHILIASS